MEGLIFGILRYANIGSCDYTILFCFKHLSFLFFSQRKKLLKLQNLQSGNRGYMKDD